MRLIIKIAARENNMNWGSGDTIPNSSTFPCDPDYRDTDHRPQGHASPDERTDEFVLIADRPMDNSDGDSRRLWLQLGGDHGSVV
jgi:hypothetical protein